ncbi:hypothetical protein BDW_06050 [Bdellovibrio bacteriovorus W]|nr:hypothetical protein BDW_06050 [Bdellovibrio bacteriovorus W]
MNFRSVSVVCLSYIFLSGCSLELSTSSLLSPPDKPVFKKLTKHEISGDFSVSLHPLEKYTFSTSDDAGNVYMMGTFRLNDRILIRALSPSGKDKIDFAHQGYLYPTTAVTVLDSLNLTGHSLLSFRNNGKSQLAAFFGTQSGSYVSTVTRGIKIIVFSSEGQLIHNGVNIQLPDNQSLSSAFVASTERNFFISIKNQSGVYILKTDLIGNPDLSFGDKGFFKVEQVDAAGPLIGFKDNSAIMVSASKGSNKNPVCHRVSSSGTVQEKLFSGITNISTLRLVKQSETSVVAVSSDLQVFGIDENCDISQTLNISLSGYPSASYALADLARVDTEIVNIYLVNKSNRAVTRVQLNLSTLNQTPTNLPAMPLAPARTDTTFKYAAHTVGKKLTLISFEDSLSAGIFNNPFSVIRETSLHHYDLDLENVDSNWGNAGHRFLNEKKEYSLLEVYTQKIAREKYIYFSGSYINDSYEYSSFLFRIDLTGKLDTSFGTNGIISVDSIINLIELDDASVVIFSYLNSGSYIIKYNPNGEVDTSFATSGRFAVSGNMNYQHFAVKDNNAYFITNYWPSTLNCIDMQTGSLTFQSAPINDSVLALSTDSQGKVTLETIRSPSSSGDQSEISIFDVSSIGNLTLHRKIFLESEEDLSYSIYKGDTLYYSHTPHLGTDVTLNLVTFNSDGSFRSSTISVFPDLIQGSMSSDHYNGMPYAYGLFDGGSYFFGRVIIYDTNGQLYERLFDSLEIQDTFASKNKKLYMTERKPSLLGNKYYLIPLDHGEFEKVQY